jgi:hypothetical protein
LELRRTIGCETECGIGAIDLLLPNEYASPKTRNIYLLKIVVAILKLAASKMGCSRIGLSGRNVAHSLR